MRWAMLGLAAGLLAATDARAAPAWVQMVAGGAEVRAISSDGRCPVVRIDGGPAPMSLRAGADPNYPALCQLALPPTARTASLDGAPLPLPQRQVRRIVLFGDTGCRIMGDQIQACNDPKAWPMAEVMRLAAARHPDLVIHVGDYYYREQPCPAAAAGCAGSPSGDGWAAWTADFFDPAAPLLRGAPWVFTRGNHETCGRGGRGWFRMLDAATPAKRCPAASDPLVVPLGGLNLYVLDSADADDRTAPRQKVAAFASQLSTLAPQLAREPGWIVTHRPIWAFVPVARVGPLGPLNLSLDLTEQAAVRGRNLNAVRMVVSGHIHDFASQDFGPSRPAQLVVGTGGDVGAPADSPKITQAVTELDGLPVSRLEFDRFGYLVLDRTGRGADDWAGIFYDAQDRPVVRCRLMQRSLRCTPAK